MLNLVPLASSHLEKVWNIESQAHSHPWKRSMIDDLSSRGAMHFAFEQDDQVVGYFYAQNIVGEVTLLNLAINPELQGQGLGTKLIEQFITLCESKNIESIWLEVRDSNQKAQALYLNAGFNEVDRRTNYYPTATGREDAIIMSYLCL
ncbi:ribosomal-protein-alanine N-acetyltransferase [Vibrio sp. UCD-FRSSP16_10]|uniref:ribosomal protein S18-alanine N-acetyltransferase n=1 Tax=unclassified Vibrio TaxID=2614977 RepID=UPI000802503C|nr:MULTISPECIES: ribosomal protein S18-alanine N-acetyltransferase [unclassified Vibrio]OBT06614.1 ribosomal-protein-alanine N-acetyltransferase [Vibrio sp. UCD-FRSSP16_30]OBT12311.1 ribosomal-protein-alanine N-acetyltransferase [Vibrio sp. UCD-FRSSP16_10]